MTNWPRDLGIIFAAGCLGGLVNSLALWLLGDLGVTAKVGVNLAPSLSPGWLYPRIVWGGLWAFLFLFPLPRRSTWLRALIFSLGPSIVQLFVVFPTRPGQGLMGFGLGVLTPLFIIFVNALWGLAAALWLVMSGKRG
ncbi:MAG: hypothetical protein JRJ59_00280 [Deltaproteobacteria bacterium]|nr:hypothetical protein [Deltaproteobacteria bacterium]